jgi:hypothetical protein
MSKKWKNKTIGGIKIIFITPPDEDGYSAGVTDGSGYSVVGVTWDPKGHAIAAGQLHPTDPLTKEFDLVPADPEVDYVYGQAMLITNARGLKELVLVDGGQGTLATDNLKLGFVDGKLVSAEVIGD